MAMSFLLAIFMLFSNAFAIELNTSLTVTSTSCYVYTDSSFSSEKLKDEENEIVLHHGDKVTYLGEQDQFYFVKITDEKEGYIYKYYLANENSRIIYPTFNASIREDCHLFDSSGNDTGIVITKNQRVFLYEGFKNKETFCPVQVVVDDQLYNGYIETKNIKPDGVNASLIIAISAISAVVTITLSLVLIKNRKKKKKKIGSQT